MSSEGKPEKPKEEDPMEIGRKKNGIYIRAIEAEAAEKDISLKEAAENFRKQARAHPTDSAEQLNLIDQAVKFLGPEKRKKP